MYVDLLRHQRSLGASAEPNLSDENIMEMKKWLAALNSLDGYVTRHYGGEKTLRGRQINVFEDLKQFLEDGKKRGYVKLPTGAGKTVLFTEFIEALNLKTLIVVPKKILVGQTADKMEEFAPEMEYGRVFSAAQEFGRQVTIITYDSLVSKLESGEINPDEYDALILDEAHKVLGQKRQEAMKKFDKQLIVGFTATPDFSETKKLSQILPDEIHAMTLEEGVAEGMLCSMSSMVVHTEADLSTVEVDKDRYSEKQLAEAVNIESRNQAAVKLYKNQFEGKLALAYCVGITHAEKVAEEFNKAGVPAVAISGKTKPKERDKILAQFKRGEIKVLCNADLLIEGFDEPEASVCFNLRPTMSWVDAEQRGGRVMRLDPNNPNKHAYVFDFLDKGISSKNVPILFADVVDGALFLSNEETKSRAEGEEGRKSTEEKVFIDIEGLQVTYDATEVMRLVAETREQREKGSTDERFRYTEAAALVKLEEAFAVWSALPESERGSFNPRWLINNNFNGLYDWVTRKLGSIQKLVGKSTNQEMKDNFTMMQKSEPYTEANIFRRLEEAFAIWSALPENTRGKFNSNWLRKNKFSGLFKWATEHISLEDLIDQSTNQALKDNFERLDRYTEASALAKVEEAFTVWSKLPENTRGRFNAYWLDKNKLSGLLNWCRKHIPIEDLIAKSTNQALKDSFERRTDKYTEATALARLEAYFAIWQALPSETRGKFNITWLLTQPGSGGLYDWTKSHTAVEDLVAKSENEALRTSFEIEKRSEKYTAENVLPRLEAAFAIWESLPSDQRSNFNANWLIEHGFHGITRWCNKNTSLSDLVATSSNEALKKAFTSDEDRYHTEASVLAMIEAGFKAWQALPAESRGKFNPAWLTNNGYGGAVDWCLRKKIALENIIAKSEDEELKEKFEKKEKVKYTEASALTKLEEVFIIWQNRPEVGRGRFNGNWLRKNGFDSLERWCLRHTSLPDLVAKSQNEDLKKAFVKMG